MTPKELYKFKEEFIDKGFLNYLPYPSVQRALDEGNIHCVFEGEELVGYVWLINLTRKPLSRVEEIISKRKGVGTLLMQWAKEHAKHSTIELKVAKHNDNAISFYKKQGFVIESEQKNNLYRMVYEKDK